MPYHRIRDGSIVSERFVAKDPPDYDARASAIVYEAGQVRLADKQCSRCRHYGSWPFLYCVSAGEVMDGVCAGCILEGGSRRDKIERCSLAVEGYHVQKATNGTAACFAEEDVPVLGKDAGEWPTICALFPRIVRS